MRHIKRVYYPGSGSDLNTLNFILSEFEDISEIFFVDYFVHLGIEQISSIDEWKLVEFTELSPRHFLKDTWSEFSYIKLSEDHKKLASKLYCLSNERKNKRIRFYQLGTEGVGTYIVLSKLDKRPELIFLSDHGFGSNWGNNVWGESKYDKVCYLKSFARPEYLIVNYQNTLSWNGYQKVKYINHRWELYGKSSL